MFIQAWLMPGRSLRLTALLIALLAGAGVPALAQDLDRSLVQPFQEAEAYLDDGAYEEAAELLEPLYRENPDTYVFFDRLLQAYEGQKEYDEAIALVNEQIAETDEARWHAEKGRLFHLKGDANAARAAWDEALATDPDNEQTYRMVYSSMAEVRAFEPAIDVMERGREHLGEATLFASELAQLYAVSGQHAQATEEYLALIEQDERRLGYVRSRLHRMFEQSDALEASLPVVEAAVQEDPTHRPNRELLAWMYLEAARYADAYDTYRAIDRLEQEDGQLLLYFAEAALEAEAYEEAVQAYDDVLEEHSESQAAARALPGRGRALEAQAEDAPEQDSLLSAALEDYQRFLDEYPNHDDYPEVLGRTATLHLDVLHDYDAAERALDRILEQYPESDAADEARFDLGRLEIKRGNFDEARLVLSRLVDDLRSGDLADRAQYEIARLHFYQGEFESAITLASALENNTSSTVANNAIELKLTIREGQGPDSLDAALHSYAEAELLHRQGQYERARSAVDELLAEHAPHPVADRALFLKATALRDDGRPDEALEVFRALAEEHPQSPLADRSLFEAAELQERHGMADSALETYMELMSQFPGSLLIPDARDRVRALRNAGA